jgi:hypothetical protein
MDIIASLPLLQIHLTAVFTTLALVIISDLHGLLWVLGKMETLPKKRMELFHRAVWVGLITVMTAGFSMFIFSPEYLLSLPAFQFKVIFILMLIINAFFIGKHLQVAHDRAFASLTSKEKATLLVSGAVSTLGWIGAYTCAQFLS